MQMWKREYEIEMCNIHLHYNCITMLTYQPGEETGAHWLHPQKQYRFHHHITGVFFKVLFH
jgi:hypothetical protein